MSVPGPDPTSTVAGSRLFVFFERVLRVLHSGEPEPLELINRQRSTLANLYWRQEKPDLSPGKVLDELVEMAVEELHWKRKVRRMRDVLSLVASTAVVMVLAGLACQFLVSSIS